MNIVTYPSYSGLRTNGVLLVADRPFWLTTAPLCKKCKKLRKIRSDKGKKRGPRRKQP